MDLIEPEWPAPAWVRAYASTRQGGVSQGPYASLNLGDHVGDDPSRVARNRALLRERLGLAEAPRWLDQVHGCDLVGDRQMACQTRVAGACQADGAVTGRPGTVCVVMTADCLPVLMCDDRGTRVAAVHAGWRGLAAGILERACAALGGEPARLLVWLGPAIGADAFEVGPEVRQCFMADDPGALAAFRPARADRWLADLAELARRRLRRLGVTGIHGGGYCTFSDSQRFFSYRRDGVTGRMASLIWLDPRRMGRVVGDLDHV
ncbi:MAG: peptidoglycan editing factor PgeF [Sphingobacteriia bacterium]|nr:peptidoglycan editing factor PgeF [Sphingobacteriia bacterium]NCC39484.1 peptidoglycan editing factor PgeF [Gammaproteobacteria bacterium]